MNKVILMGRLARDPEFRTTQTGKQIARMTIAVDRRISRANVQPGQQTADFIGLVAWDRTAEFADKYLNKGSQILVEGRIQTGSYEAQDGTKRYTTDVIVEHIDFAGSRSQSAADGGFAPRNSAPAEPAAPSFNNAPIADEDIPF